METNQILLLLAMSVGVTLYIMRRRVRLGRRTPKF
jgi:hypothetical protein